MGGLLRHRLVIERGWGAADFTQWLAGSLAAALLRAPAPAAAGGGPRPATRSRRCPPPRPGQLAAWIRGHQKIENQLHRVRGVTYGEDAFTARTGTGPHVTAAIRNLVISILRLAGHAGIAAALRHAARDPARAVRLLTGRK